MIVIPSLDVRDRTYLPEGGTLRSATLLRNDADVILRTFLRFGFSRFQIAELDLHAGQRRGCNLIASLLSEYPSRIQVSTHDKRRDHVDDLLRAGANFVVVSPEDVNDEDWLLDLADDGFRPIIVAVDVNTRRLHIPAAQTVLPRDAADWIEEISHLAPSAVLVRSVDVQGHAAPCDFAFLEDLVENVTTPIFAAGVLETLGELHALQDRGVAGALLGECLQTGRIDPWIAAQEFCA